MIYTTAIPHQELMLGACFIPAQGTRDYDWVNDAAIDLMHDLFGISSCEEFDDDGVEVQEEVQSACVVLAWRLRSRIAPQFYTSAGFPIHDDEVDRKTNDWVNYQGRHRG